MAESSGFYPGIRYGSDDFTNMLESLVTKGFVLTSTSSLQVLESTGMQIMVNAGYAWSDYGCFYKNDGIKALTISTASGSANRIDRIVIRYDKILGSAYAAIVKGTYAISPVAPDLTRDGTIFELGIAEIRINAGIIAITQEMITDTRYDDTVCGIATVVPPQISMNDIITQINAEWNTISGQMTQQIVNNQHNFDVWFNDLTITLDGDVASNLYNLANSKDYMYSAGGTATALMITVPNVTDYLPGKMYWIIPAYDNNGVSTTININSLGTKPLYKANTTKAPRIKALVPILVYINAANTAAYIVKGGNEVIVQRGIVALTAAATNVTIAAVDTTKSWVEITFYGQGIASANGQYDNVRAELTSSTNITLSTYHAMQNGSAAWQVITID